MQEFCFFLRVGKPNSFGDQVRASADHRVMGRYWEDTP